MTRTRNNKEEVEMVQGELATMERYENGEEPADEWKVQEVEPCCDDSAEWGLCTASRVLPRVSFSPCGQAQRDARGSGNASRERGERAGAQRVEVQASGVPRRRGLADETADCRAGCEGY
jgi:hypothetical protein